MYPWKINHKEEHLKKIKQLDTEHDEAKDVVE